MVHIHPHRQNTLTESVGREAVKRSRVVKVLVFRDKGELETDNPLRKQGLNQIIVFVMAGV